MDKVLNLIPKDKIEILKQAQEERKRVLVGTLRPKKNHILFEFDLNTGLVDVAKFCAPQEVSFEDAKKVTSKFKKEVEGKEGCYYVSALNLENAWKKVNKM